MLLARDAEPSCRHASLAASEQEATLKAMSELGFGADEVSSIFDVVGALLHLTNADFDADATVTHSDSHAKLSSLAPVEAAARLLGIEQHRDLVGALTSVRVRDTVNAFTAL